MGNSVKMLALLIRIIDVKLPTPVKLNSYIANYSKYTCVLVPTNCAQIPHNVMYDIFVSKIPNTCNFTRKIVYILVFTCQIHGHIFEANVRRLLVRQIFRLHLGTQISHTFLNLIWLSSSEFQSTFSKMRGHEGQPFTSRSQS